jgi:hypothetical protein
MIKLKHLLKEMGDATQAILTNDPAQLFFGNLENHIDIVERLYSDEMSEMTKEMERMGHSGNEQDSNDARYAAANAIAYKHGFARVVVEGDTLYFNTEKHRELSNQQMRVLTDYCLLHGLELVHAMGMKKR